MVYRFNWFRFRIPGNKASQLKVCSCTPPFVPAGLPHATHDDWRDADAVQALYTAAEPFMPDTVASDTDSAATDNSCDSQAPSASDDSS